PRAHRTHRREPRARGSDEAGATRRRGRSSAGARGARVPARRRGSVAALNTGLVVARQRSRGGHDAARPGACQVAGGSATHVQRSNIMDTTVQRPAVDIGPHHGRPGLALLLAILSLPGSTIAWDLPAGGLWIGLPLGVAAIVLAVRARREA